MQGHCSCFHMPLSQNLSLPREKRFLRQEVKLPPLPMPSTGKGAVCTPVTWHESSGWGHSAWHRGPFHSIPLPYYSFFLQIEQPNFERVLVWKIFQQCPGDRISQKEVMSVFILYTGFLGPFLAICTAAEVLKSSIKQGKSIHPFVKLCLSHWTSITKWMHYSLSSVGLLNSCFNNF